MLSDIILYFNLFLALFLNGVISFPSSQIIYLGLGYFLAEKSYTYVLFAILFASLGNAIGNFVLYYIFFFKNETFKEKIAVYLKLDQDKIDSYIAKAKNHSHLWVFLGKLVPSVKVFIPIIAALLKIRPFVAFFLFLLGSLVWACLLVSIGFYFGQSVSLKTFYICLFVIYIVLFFVFKKKSAQE